MILWKSHTCYGSRWFARRRGYDLGQSDSVSVPSLQTSQAMIGIRIEINSFPHRPLVPYNE